MERFGPPPSTSPATSRHPSSVIELSDNFQNPNYTYVPGSVHGGASFAYMQVPLTSGKQLHPSHGFHHHAASDETDIGNHSITNQQGNPGHQYLNNNNSIAMAPFVLDEDVNGPDMSLNIPQQSLSSPTKPSRFQLVHTSNRKRMDKNSDEYRKRRERNNVAVRKSREKAKVKSRETEERVGKLLRENEQLQKRTEILQEELSVLRSMFSTVDAFQDHIQ